MVLLSGLYAIFTKGPDLARSGLQANATGSNGRFRLSLAFDLGQGGPTSLLGESHPRGGVQVMCLSWMWSKFDFHICFGLTEAEAGRCLVAV